jgi:hypothetical protein
MKKERTASLGYGFVQVEFYIRPPITAAKCKKLKGEVKINAKR